MSTYGAVPAWEPTPRGDYRALTRLRVAITVVLCGALLLTVRVFHLGQQLAIGVDEYQAAQDGFYMDEGTPLCSYTFPRVCPRSLRHRCRSDRTFTQCERRRIKRRTRYAFYFWSTKSDMSWTYKTFCVVRCARLLEDGASCSLRAEADGVCKVKCVSQSPTSATGICRSTILDNGEFCHPRDTSKVCKEGSTCAYESWQN